MREELAGIFLKGRLLGYFCASGSGKTGRRKPKTTRCMEPTAQKDRTLELQLFGYLDRQHPQGVDSDRLLQKLEEAKMAGMDRVRLRIHSGGGNVMEGQALFSALRHSGLVVETVIEGIAASTASMVAMAGDTVKMASHGLLMIHEPSVLAGDKNLSEMRKATEGLEAFRDSLLAIYRERTGLADEQLRDWMAAEKWFSAEEAREAGFVDEIVRTGRQQAEDPHSMSIEEVFAAYRGSMDADAAATQEGPKGDPLERLREENRALQEQVEALEASIGELRQQQAEELTRNALSAGKIEARHQGYWRDLALEDPERAQRLLESIPAAKGGRIRATIADTEGDSRGSWTIRDWERQDPQGLKQLRLEEPERYQQMVEAYYGVRSY